MALRRTGAEAEGGFVYMTIRMNAGAAQTMAKELLTAAALAQGQRIVVNVEGEKDGHKDNPSG
jgi:hypothetical protein